MQDWVALSRRAAGQAAEALANHSLGELGQQLERGEGGDVTMLLDRVAEDAIVAEFRASGRSATVISEEAGTIPLHQGGPPFIVVDPIDGSLNAKRGLPFHGVSIAVASGMRMSEVVHGFILDLGSGDEWHASSGQGAFRNGERLPQLDAGDDLEIVGLETARPELIAEHADWIAGIGASRIRALGSVALSMCLVAAGSLDGMISLRPIRSVDCAAAQLLVREAGGDVAYPEAGEDPGLGLDMRTRVAAAGPGRIARLL